MTTGFDAGALRLARPVTELRCQLILSKYLLGLITPVSDRVLKWAVLAVVVTCTSADKSLMGIGGYYFSCGIDDNGLSCWNSQGGSNLESSPSLANPSVVDSGEGFACAIDSGDLKCWARNSSEVLFNRTVSNPQILGVRTVPCVLDDAGVSCDFLGGRTDLTNVPNLVAPTDVVVARDYACAVDQGELVCWGAAPDVDLGQGVSALEGRADVFWILRWIDNDGDGIGDNADTDDDGDGVEDVNDAFPLDSAGLRIPTVMA